MKYTAEVIMHMCGICEDSSYTAALLTHVYSCHMNTVLTLKVLVMTIDARWEGMGDVGSARYEPALLPPCPTIRVLSYSN